MAHLPMATSKHRGGSRRPGAGRNKDLEGTLHYVGARASEMFPHSLNKTQAPHGGHKALPNQPHELSDLISRPLLFAPSTHTGLPYALNTPISFWPQGLPTCSPLCVNALPLPFL